MIRRILGTAVTTLIVVAAVVLVGWFVLAQTTGATLTVFRTGSMTPTMPQGAIAITMPVRAADVQVGDVITVQRSERALPITHRVIEIRSPEEATQAEPIPADAREIVMQGDDNAQPDFEPYVIRDAKRVVWSMPQLGAWLMVLQSRLGVGVLIVVVGAITTWAFWPSKRDSASEEDADSADEDSDPNPQQQAADAPATEETPSRVSSPQQEASDRPEPVDAPAAPGSASRGAAIPILRRDRRTSREALARSEETSPAEVLS